VPTAVMQFNGRGRPLACGAGEILLTSMDRDGTQCGFDCELVRAVAEAISIPVIAQGAQDRRADFIDVFRDGRADAALAASIFHFGIENIAQLKRELHDASIPVRWPWLIPSIDLNGRQDRAVGAR